MDVYYAAVKGIFNFGCLDLIILVDTITLLFNGTSLYNNFILLIKIIVTGILVGCNKGIF